MKWHILDFIDCGIMQVKKENNRYKVIDYNESVSNFNVNNKIDMRNSYLDALFGTYEIDRFICILDECHESRKNKILEKRNYPFVSEDIFFELVIVPDKYEKDTIYVLFKDVSLAEKMKVHYEQSLLYEKIKKDIVSKTIEEKLIINVIVDSFDIIKNAMDYDVIAYFQNNNYEEKFSLIYQKYDDEKRRLGKEFENISYYDFYDEFRQLSKKDTIYIDVNNNNDLPTLQELLISEKIDNISFWKLYNNNLQNQMQLDDIHGFIVMMNYNYNDGRLIRLNDDQKSLMESVQTSISQAISFRGAEYTLESREAFLNAIVGNTSELILTVSNGGYIDNISPSWYQATGYLYEESYGVLFETIIHEEDIEKINEAFKISRKEFINRGYNTANDSGFLQTKAVEREDVEVRIIKKDGEISWFDMTIAYFGNESFSFSIVILNDITKEKISKQQLIHMSYHDKLTGLYNRAFFEEEVRRLDNERNYPLSVIMGDVNGLKITNDVFGHEKGDLLLVKIANILKTTCRGSDIIARWGGDEFVILLPNADMDDCAEITKRIKYQCDVSEGVIGEINLSISFGYETKYDSKISMQEILSNAEKYMYRRKLLESKSTKNAILQSLRNTLYEKDNETEEHAFRLASNCKKVGERLGLNENELNDLELFSMLHDIGKVAIDDSILNKPGKLDRYEYEQIKKHSDIGYRIAKSSQDFVQIADYILYHHERWDGKGYPQGLKEKEVPLLSRILSVVDAYDAMTNDRPYRKAIPKEHAIKELKYYSGIQFDPEIVELFINIIENE